MGNGYEDITVVLQGSIATDKGILPSCDYIVEVVRSIKEHLAGAQIILSTWEGQDVPSSLKIDKIIFNKDPGSWPRGEDPCGKQNNVNRQIVSTINGLRCVVTPFSLKLRTDFILSGRGFVDIFDKYNAYENKYKVVNKRVVVCMFGTRKPRAKHYNLPFHVADFSTFGLTEDLVNLYDISIVTKDEFDYFIMNKHINRESFAVNKYNAEQSIIINFLKKNGRKVSCEYCTHVNDEIEHESNHFLVNNFVPLPFSGYGIRSLKQNLLPGYNLFKYTDYYTPYEWETMYRKYCDSSYEPGSHDDLRSLINKTIKEIKKIERIQSGFKYMPTFLKNIIGKALNPKKATIIKLINGKL
jgi:hypothetical protein